MEERVHEMIAVASKLSKRIGGGATAAAATAGSEDQSERQEKARAWPRRYVRLNLPLMPSHSHTYAMFLSSSALV